MTKPKPKIKTLAVWSQSSARWQCTQCRSQFHTANSARFHMDVAHNVPWAMVVQVAKPGGTFLQVEEPSGFNNLNAL